MAHGLPTSDYELAHQRKKNVVPQPERKPSQSAANEAIRDEHRRKRVNTLARHMPPEEGAVLLDAQREAAEARAAADRAKRELQRAKR